MGGCLPGLETGQSSLSHSYVSGRRILEMTLCSLFVDSQRHFQVASNSLWSKLVDLARAGERSELLLEGLVIDRVEVDRQFSSGAEEGS